jgi:putative FmdB family regulatory protein
MAPTYEYRCEGGGEVFEKRQPIADRETAACPQHGTPGRLKPSGGQVVFWYPRPPGKDGFTSKTYSSRSEALRQTRPARVLDGAR